MDLAELEGEIIDSRFKGIPGHATPFPLGEIRDQGWNVLDEDLPHPLLVLKRSALDQNIALMRDYCRDSGVLLAPHGKTTMAPQLFKRQLDAGAWAMTAATAEQLLVYRRFGVGRVLFANQLVGRANLRYVMEELRDDPQFEFFCFADSRESVEILSAASEETVVERPVRILAEVGHRGGRAGARSLDVIDDLCAAVDQTKGRVELYGVAGFEGLLSVQRFATAEQEAVALSVDVYLESIAEAVEHLRRRGMLPEGFLVSAGGSSVFDKVVEILRPVTEPDGRLVLRSGCYITHDHGMYAATSPLRESLAPALELWSYVQSCPEPGLSILGFGRRDAPFDYGLPVPVRLLAGDGDGKATPRGSEIISLNDQHAYMRYPPAADVKVGDRVVCGISHPCTAFDKWSLVPMVDDDYNVIEAIRTFF
ncbi:MAG: amino acid deaminase [Actinobacteria bacterium]|nr:amino acid deaminase [Actinomycetota bacterium]